MRRQRQCLEAEQLQFIAVHAVMSHGDRVVGKPVAVRDHVHMVQTAQNTVEVSQVLYIGRIADGAAPSTNQPESSDATTGSRNTDGPADSGSPTSAAQSQRSWISLCHRLCWSRLLRCQVDTARASFGKNCGEDRTRASRRDSTGAEHESQPGARDR